MLYFHRRLGRHFFSLRLILLHSSDLYSKSNSRIIDAVLDGRLDRDRRLFRMLFPGFRAVYGKRLIKWVFFLV
jgi:hypothetical protein